MPMPKKKKKFYAVWKGHKTGVFNSWHDCKLQIENYKGAEYKSFSSIEEAKHALQSSYIECISKAKQKKQHRANFDLENIGQPDYFSIAVDAASSGNPGTMEYRGVDTKTKTVLFHKGPFEHGTNNVGEFLALVHGLAYLKEIKSNRVLYTDSRIAMGWVMKKKCNTKLVCLKENEVLFDLIKRAELWLKENSFNTRIVKWETKAWGEIPADFGRK
jgi:ribonuclease HI